jgi:hypothetical protein
MLGLGLRWTISSFNSLCRSDSVRSTLRRDSVSSVSSSRDTERGFPVRLGLGLFMHLGVAGRGRRAFARAGDVLIGSSSGAGDGEAFRFREDEGVVTGQKSSACYDIRGSI